jgi:hypothetical protein
MNRKMLKGGNPRTNQPLLLLSDVQLVIGFENEGKFQQ